MAIDTAEIQDIQDVLLITDNSDIKKVLNNLLNDSYNHLAAFNSWPN